MAALAHTSSTANSQVKWIVAAHDVFALYHAHAYCLRGSIDLDIVYGLVAIIIAWGGDGVGTSL